MLFIYLREYWPFVFWIYTPVITRKRPDPLQLHCYKYRPLAFWMQFLVKLTHFSMSLDPYYSPREPRKHTKQRFDFWQKSSSNFFWSSLSALTYNLSQCIRYSYHLVLSPIHWLLDVCLECGSLTDLYVRHFSAKYRVIFWRILDVFGETILSLSSAEKYRPTESKEASIKLVITEIWLPWRQVLSAINKSFWSAIHMKFNLWIQ